MWAADLIRSCEAVVFDCAGTLLQLDPSREVIFRDAAADLGLDLALSDIARAYEMVDFAVKMRSSALKSEAQKSEFYKTFNSALCLALGIHGSLSLLHPILMQRFATRRRWVPYDDAAQALRMIGQRIPVHALANWDKTLDEVLSQAGLRNLLCDAAASEILGAEKPARTCFDAFLKRNELDPSRTIYVGNEYAADVVGSREAGLIPVLVDRDDRQPAADCLRIRTLGELVPT
jgi:putative hydrolase of the HAD superfamily